MGLSGEVQEPELHVEEVHLSCHCVTFMVKILYTQHQICWLRFFYFKRYIIC